MTVTLPIGDTLDIVVTITDGESAANLSGATIRYAVGKTASSTGEKVFIEKSVGSGITVAGNVATVTLDPDDTEDMEPGTYYQEMEVVFSGGRVATVEMDNDLKLNRTLIRSA